MKRQRIKIEGPTSKTSFDLPDDLLDRLRKVCDGRNIFRNAAVIDAIERWVEMDKSGQAGPVPVPAINHTHNDSDKISPVNPGDKWERARRQLQEIANSKDEDTQDAILSNLFVFTRNLQGAGRERKNPRLPTKRAKTDILGKVPGAIARANSALAKKNDAPEIIDGNRGDHNGDKPGDPGRRTSGSSGSKG